MNSTIINGLVAQRTKARKEMFAEAETLARHNTIAAAQMPNLFRLLRDRIEDSCEQIRASELLEGKRNDLEFHSIPSLSFEVRKRTLPAISLRCEADLCAREIRYRYVERQTKESVSVETSPRVVYINVGANDEIELLRGGRNMSLDELAEEMVIPVASKIALP